MDVNRQLLQTRWPNQHTKVLIFQDYLFDWLVWFIHLYMYSFTAHCSPCGGCLLPSFLVFFLTFPFLVSSSSLTCTFTTNQKLSLPDAARSFSLPCGNSLFSWTLLLWNNSPFWLIRISPRASGKRFAIPLPRPALFVSNLHREILDTAPLAPSPACVVNKLFRSTLLLVFKAQGGIFRLADLSKIKVYSVCHKRKTKAANHRN